MSVKNIPTASTLPSSSRNFVEPPSTRRAVFTRKRQIDDVHNEKQVNYFPTRNSREKNGTQKEGSFDALKGKIPENGWLGQIKYLSPHFTRSPNFISPPQKKEVEVKQKFIRKPEVPRQTSRDRCSKKNLTETPPPHKLDNFNVENSLESMLTKNSDMTEIEGTARNWFSLETENDILKQQKAKLEKEKTMLSDQLAFLQDFLKKERICIPKTYKKLTPTHCHSCQQLSLEFASKLQEKQKNFDEREKQLMNRLKQQQFQIDLLKEQLQATSEKYERQKEGNSELLQLIEALKQEYIEARSKHESTAVKQDILMRKKSQFDNAKILAQKAEKERQNLRKTLGEYKKKMGNLNQMIARNKKEKERLDQTLDYSLDLSTSFDYN